MIFCSEKETCFWISLLGHKNLLNFDWDTIKFYKCHHINLPELITAMIDTRLEQITNNFRNENNSLHILWVVFFNILQNFAIHKNKVWILLSKIYKVMWEFDNPLPPLLSHMVIKRPLFKKFHSKRIKIVDFQFMANFWTCIIFLPSLY